MFIFMLFYDEGDVNDVLHIDDVDVQYLMHDADDVHADDNGHCSWLREQ